MTTNSEDQTTMCIILNLLYKFAFFHLLFNNKLSKYWKRPQRNKTNFMFFKVHKQSNEQTL